MATTDRHNFLLWAAGFKQSDTLLNDLLLKLEVKLGLSVVSRTETAPVGGDSDGDCYIIPGSPTGAFAAFSEHQVVILRDGTWYAVTPISGWSSYVEDDTETVMFNGSAWAGGGAGGLTASIKTAEYELTGDEAVGGDSTGGGFDFILKLSPEAGDSCILGDAASNCGTTPIGIQRNGETIRGVAEDEEINVDDAAYYFIFDGTTWQFIPFVAGGLNQDQVDTRVALYDPSGGSFTPVIMDNALDSGLGQTYTNQQGKYKKIGNLIHFWINIEVLGLGTLNTAQLTRIGGLPFASAAGMFYPVSIGFANQLNITAGHSVSGYVADGGSYVNLTKFSAAAGTSNLIISEFSADGRIFISGSYPLT